MPVGGDEACPFYDGTFDVSYVKGSGPGNFVPGLDTYINGSDQAIVRVESYAEQDDADIPDEPQDSCISRVLFESEDQGQVDIEAFILDQTLRGASARHESDINVTKHAFVIYYMKINTINVSLVTQVSKPDHNATSDNEFDSDYGASRPPARMAITRRATRGTQARTTRITRRNGTSRRTCWFAAG